MTENKRITGFDNLPPHDEPPPLTDEDCFPFSPSWDMGELDKALHRQKTEKMQSIKVQSDITGQKQRREKRNPGNLKEILKKFFHFDSFRPYQQSVCESVVKGKDLLLVMPTGSGKSLCYQLPGIALKGTTLVVSPLIALMEDQVAGLKEQGLRAERIHSGRARIESRKVCREYLDGKLDFLFISPERLAVPGFPEMLARSRPVLIAIDEAHCISQWGHDFRPDYRLLGNRLPILRPAPVLAMTATATPRVQKDIVQQLGIDSAEMCIHGFRRTNISIELIELLPSERTGKVEEILSNKEFRPAIIYAPTRQKTEDLAEELKRRLSVEPYHAGLSPQVRERVQTSFLAGELDAIVATIAFGMGIDKPDIRTVIHTAMPGSLEGYYQEIGRAGRDGQPSRAILLHSYGDRRVHEFFHEKTYPRESVLMQIYKQLADEKVHSEKLRDRLKMEQEEFDVALEKLWIHGGALIDPDERVCKGHDRWPVTYKNQSFHRLEQIDEISRFVNSFSCRMLYLVQHFGDRADDGRRCGICDFCAPENSMSSKSRKSDTQEEIIVSEVISILKKVDSLSTGRVYTEACPGSSFPRSDFENILRVLVKLGLISLSEHTFEKDGQLIHFKKAELTNKGYGLAPEDIRQIEMTFPPRVQKSLTSSRKIKIVKAQKPQGSGASENPELYDILRKWRMGKAKKRGLPAFRIFTNKVLDNLASDLPANSSELLMVDGVGPNFVEQYGKEVISMVKKYLRNEEG
jgi:DNA topoisomerase-3